MSALLVTSLFGCSQIGPGTIAGARFDYNEAIVRSFDHQMLLNLVRLRYQDSIHFLDLTSVVASYRREGTVGSSASGETDPQAVSLGVVGSASWSESPTITYAPLQGEEFAKRLLTPIQPSTILLLSRSGWGLERLLLCTVQQLNDLPNGTSIGGVAPVRVRYYKKFQRVAYLLRELQETGHLQLKPFAAQPDQVALTTGPVQLDDDSRQQLTEVLSLLDIRPPTDVRASDRTSSSSAQGALQINPMEPSGANLVKQSETDAQVDTMEKVGGATIESLVIPKELPRIALSGRSILGVLTFLAQLVDVPELHQKLGLVRIARGPDGEPFDWQKMSRGLFRVRSSASAPERAFLRVRYREHWFYIDDNDLESKSTYTLVAQLFSLQAASSNATSPMLTLPAR
jgi:hypothetical protein